MSIRHSTKSRYPITDMAEATAERVRLGGDILIAPAHAVAANEKTQRRFRTAVLIRLSKIETMLTEIQGAQLVQLWPPDRVYEHQRNEWVQEVQDRVDKASNEMGLKMVRFIYGEGEASEEVGARRARRRNWSGWEI